jgi:hypothetical protein
LLAASIVCAGPASATLSTEYSISGDVGLSVDAGGSTASTLPNGLTADVPVGSQVVAAYLYTSTYDETFTTGSTISQADAGGTLAGTTVNYTALIPNASSDLPLQGGVANVTSIVQSVVNPMGANAVGGVYSFATTETNTGLQDGEVLVVVYSNPTLPTASIGILDGAASSAGDTSSIEFASNPSGSTVLMSVGDGFSYDLGGETSQYSTIDVDGSLLTSAAGNCDESQDGGTPPNATGCNNGDLITAGVLGLNGDGSLDTSYSNPITPIGDTDTSTDHELYNISSLIDPSAGDTITLSTQNTSADDNIFEEAFYVEGLAGFNAPPPNTTAPEPSTFAMLGLGLLGLVAMRRYQGVKLSA